MAIQKRPYELSVWVEKLNGSNSKIEEKGVIIGAHDMSYPGKATNIVLKREIKGTNTLTFQLPDRYFDSLKGDYVRNEFADLIAPETKLKLFYKDRWFEFFVKKVEDKKQFKSYMKSFTCSDAFIDELSRNGYGITYDTDLYNNVEEIGTFTEETLEDSIWQYHPENNWGDFTEYKEEKLYRIPVSCFGGHISGYKLNFELTKEQREEIAEKTGTDCIINPFTKDERPVELSDDLSRGFFWDEYTDEGEPRNPLTKDFHENIPNDGYIYVPYSCLGFCYGSKTTPDFDEELKYDRAATETAIDVEGKLILAPQSVDPRTIIQFYAIPNTAMLELDDGGVIMNKDYTFFVTLAQWNRMVEWGEEEYWYMFEDTRLVRGEILGSADVAQPCISHTFKYLLKAEKPVLNTDFESRGNRCVTYDGYLSDVNENYIVKGKKFSITNRSEINISEEIDQYTTVYNAHADDFESEYSNEDWNYAEENRTTNGKQYRVCSKLETRQVIPQLARNLIQNGIKMDSVNGWSPMAYLTEENILTTPRVTQRGIIKSDEDEQISSSCLMFSPTVAQIAYIWKIKHTDGDNTPIEDTTFTINGTNYRASSLNDSHAINSFINSYLNPLVDTYIYAIGTRLFTKTQKEDPKTHRMINEYVYLCDKNDAFYKGLIRINREQKTPFTITQTTEIEIITPDEDNQVRYYVDTGEWDKDITIDGNNYMWGRTNIAAEEPEKALVTSGTSMINFGIIGQDKIIEKEKIYCLGVQAIPRPSMNDTIAKTFKIKLGKGSLVSEGNYTIAENTTLTFDAEDVIDIDYTRNFHWNESHAGDEKKNIIISAEPKTKFLLFKTNYNIENPYFVVECEGEVILLKLYLFEAYTKGVDCFDEDNALYRYSGRDLFWPPKGNVSVIEVTRDGQPIAQKTSPYIYPTDSVQKEDNIHKQIIFEDDIMLGSTYGYQHYYIQRLRANLTRDGERYTIDCDTMGQKEFISSDVKKINETSLPLDAALCTSDDYKVETNYIDLNRCSYYDKDADINECDCTYGGKHTCFYQKFGYCPFRFKTEKHNRRVRTLSINKSNRFNIIQQTSKVFEVYPQFFIEHKSNGSVIKDDEGNYLKKVFYITEKGRENKVGFRYEKNLKDISRTIVSDKIVTKLYVLDVDSDLSKTGLCSIKSAEDNPSKDSYIVDLSYFVEKGMLDAEEVEQDLYGITPTRDVIKGDEIPSGFLRQLGYYNGQYDDLSNKIINLQDASFTELEANLTVNYQGIITAQEQILKIKKQIDRYKEMYSMKEGGAEKQQSYQNYLNKLAEQQSILAKFIDLTFFTDGVCDDNLDIWDHDCFINEGIRSDMTPMEFFDHVIDLEESKKYWIDQHGYTKGILGQFNSEYLQIQQWKRERASYLKLINQISSSFYKKYEPYLKEGTWSDNNYLTDNAYYFGALDVAADGAIPKVSYSISVIDLAPLNEEYEGIYDFDLADITYVEDIGMFGINKHTGFPNKLKVLVSSVSEGLDDPSKDTISVQNFTTSFQDLFQQVTASVQSLIYNENIYKRSSNFTSMQNITTSSLQGALDTNDLTLLDTDENNIQVDNTGTSGSDINNHANKYKLDGQGLYFSNDGGQHWSVGVGPSGINADYIRVGTLDAGRIRIADSAYVYFSWDKEGIVAYRDPKAINTDENNINDAAIFNKYGLSIVEKNKIKLRAGYAFNGTGKDEEAGLMSTETELADEVGFYLYNTAGKVIFSTSTASSESEADRDTATLKLVGEMLVTNTTEKEVTVKYDYKNKYVFNTIYYSPYLVSQVRPDISSESMTDPPEEYPNLRICDISNTSYSYEEAAAHLFYKESGLNYNEIAITKAGTMYIYEKVGTINNDSLIDYYLYEGGNANVIQSANRLTNQITVTVKRNDSTLTKIIVFFPWKNNQIYISNIVTFKSGFKYTDITSDMVVNHDKVKPTALLFYEEALNGNFYLKNYNSYYIDNNWYQQENGGSGSGSTISADASVALYLNNPSMEASIGNVSPGFAQRLFICCGQNGNEVSNLFAVLKDGTAYFGGRVHDKPANPSDSNASAIELNDIIKIEAPGIKIDSNGNMYIAFDRIMNVDNQNQKLTDYVAEVINREIGNASSQIYQAISNVVETVNAQTGGLQTQIDEILIQISAREFAHSHDIHFESIEFTGPSSAQHHSVSADNIIIDVRDNNDWTKTVTLGDLFRYTNDWREVR